MKMCPTDKKDLENLYSGNSFRNFQLNVAIMKLKHDFFKFHDDHSCITKQLIVIVIHALGSEIN